jgi:hypothetical protein
MSSLATYRLLATFDMARSDTVDYGALTEALAAIGMRRYVVVEGGQRVELPNNTYAGEGRASDEQEAARNACMEIRAVLFDFGQPEALYVRAGLDTYGIITRFP